MKTKQHNKKRNTAFLFEVLAREYTKAALAKEETYRKQLLKVIQEHFGPKTVLGEELKLYRSLYKEVSVPKRIAEKYLAEAKRSYATLNVKKIYDAQTVLLEKIRSIDKDRKSKILDNFVPNYKSLATIAQIFGRANLSVQSRVVLEESLLRTMTASEGRMQESILEPVDSLTYKTFSTKFEETYGSRLLTEQKTLLNKLIFSFTDGGAGFRVYLNEELGRLKVVLSEAAKNESYDKEAKKVIEILDSFGTKRIDEAMMKKLLEIQELAKELEE